MAQLLEHVRAILGLFFFDNDDFFKRVEFCIDFLTDFVSFFFDSWIPRNLNSVSFFVDCGSQHDPQNPLKVGAMWGHLGAILEPCWAYLAKL